MPGNILTPISFTNYSTNNYFGLSIKKFSQNSCSEIIKPQISKNYDSFKKSKVPNNVITVAENLVALNIRENDESLMKITQGRVEQWCADTVNYIYEKAYGKNPFGKNKDGSYANSTVMDLEKWGIKHSKFKEAKGKDKIIKQLKTIKAGDVVIFKSPFTVKISTGESITRHASHTGIVKNVKNGVLTLIEGNANISKKNDKGEYLLVHNFQEGINGNQAIGDFQKVNRYNALIEKHYKTQDLIDSGYSGYINM